MDGYIIYFPAPRAMRNFVVFCIVKWRLKFHYWRLVMANNRLKFHNAFLKFVIEFLEFRIFQFKCGYPLLFRCKETYRFFGHKLFSVFSSNVTGQRTAHLVRRTLHPIVGCLFICHYR